MWLLVLNIVSRCLDPPGPTPPIQPQTKPQPTFKHPWPTNQPLFAYWRIRSPPFNHHSPIDESSKKHDLRTHALTRFIYIIVRYIYIYIYIYILVERHLKVISWCTDVHLLWHNFFYTLDVIFCQVWYNALFWRITPSIKYSTAEVHIPDYKLLYKQIN